MRNVLRLGAWLASLALATSLNAECPPNVILVVMDDVGWRDIQGINHNPVLNRTPSIKRLAQLGRTYQGWSASSVCSPTRAAMLTGLWPVRTGVTRATAHQSPEILEAFVTDGKVTSANRLLNTYYTLGEAMRDAGYDTFHMGKWHLGQPPYVPKNHGFAQYMPEWWGPGLPPGGYIGWDAGAYQPETPNQHIEDWCWNRVNEYISTPRSKPFFLNWWMFSSHGPWEGKQNLIDAYAGDPENSPVYAAMMKSADMVIGKLLDRLIELEIDDNTVIIFTSDNGGVTFKTHHYDGVDYYPSDNSPAKDGKGTLYEGGTRVPYIFIWPGHIEPGTWCTQYVHTVDIYPTILDIIGEEPRAGVTFDGRSIRPTFEGAALPGRALYWVYTQPQSNGKPPGASVIYEGMKLIVYFNGVAEPELYDLTMDCREAYNRAVDQPVLVDVMTDMLLQHFSDTGAAVPSL